MADSVGVDPERLDQLATKLERLSNTIAAKAPMIINVMSQYDTGLSLALLQAAQQRSAEDAVDMRMRAQLAENLERTAAVALSPGAPPPRPGQIGVLIPWSAISPDSVAQADAQLLTQAESDPNGPQSRAEILSVEADIKDHMGDSTYLAELYNDAGPQVAALAKTLHQQDGADDVLSAQDAGILKAFAAGLAKASTSASFNYNAVSRAFTHAPDMWSSAILFKYTSGEAFSSPDGTRLLASMSKTVLTDANDHDPTLSAPLPAPPHSTDINDVIRFQNLQADYDPVVAVIGTTAGNPAAAQDVLNNGKSGQQYAGYLLNYPWNTGPASYNPDPYQPHEGESQGAVTLPGIDTSATAVAFLNAATEAPGGDMSEPAAWAVTNIVDAVSANPKLSSAPGTPPAEVLPHNIRLAFIEIAQRNLLGFTVSAGGQAGGSGPQPSLNNIGWQAQPSSAQLQAFLGQALNDPGDCGRYMAFLNAQIPGAVSATVGQRGGTDYLGQLSELAGVVQQVQTNLNFGEQEQQAAQSAENEMMLSMLSAGLLAIPGDDAATTAFKNFVAISTPLTPLSQTGGDPSAALEAGELAKMKESGAVKPLVVQGLVNAHAIPVGLLTEPPYNVPPPKGDGFYDSETGSISPNPGFWRWLASNGDTTFAKKTLESWIHDATLPIDNPSS